MFETVLLGITSFIGTNMDDLFVNMLFFSEVQNGKDGKKILLGKYFGISLLILVSMMMARGLQMFPKKYVAFLGAVPIFLGVKEIIATLRSNEESRIELKGRAKALTVRVMMVTIANGADNMGIYIPLFASFALWQTVMVCIIFLIMTTCWYYISKKLAEWRPFHQLIAKYKKVMIPTVYMILGIYIFLKGV